MTDFNFKEGDKVYYPSATNEVLRVSSNFIVPYLDTDGEDTNARIRHGGKFYDFHHNPAFFPATQEWYDKLVHVYPDLEKPPVRKTPEEIIRAMLDDGWRGVPCWVSDSDIDASTRRDIIVRFGSTGDYIYRNTDGYGWRYAKPFDPRTGKDIVDYADGKVVFE